ncbi:GNAT family N-acetyltransferase [Phyllobacterium salinisoli]|uniref:GNAT family N-acetyltransferase n=1 Tax=Phyllobacterium salinisoli TaxID=1899321 RepID=A0A368K910_9HYPH|nr:GNAT family N-acetyltransferase [Phyllobacterium salinisoli]RCS24902.1 GNAT family N-acetyltransferase [Phyllobacterium salinisoli]
MSGAQLQFVWSGLDGLSPRDLYAMLKLRVDIFVVEQKCPYPEIDGRDLDALHLRVLDKGSLAAYLRVLPPAGEGSARIGRVVVAPSHRGRKLGEQIMLAAIAHCRECFPGHDIELGAQSHLKTFYGSFGFVPVSDEYLEDSIPHIDMRLAA